MYKKIIALVLIVVFIFMTGVCPFAVDDKSSENNMYSFHRIIDNPNELKKIEKDEQTALLLDGYHLENVIIDQYICEPIFQSIPSKVENNTSIEPYALLYKIKNVKTESPFIFPDIYELNVYQGPAKISETYTRSEKVGLSTGVRIGKSTVSAAVNYDVSKEYTVSKTFSVTVASGKILHVKVHIIYRRTSFDIYNKYTNNLVRKYAYADKPIGLQFTQYIYG